jgi:ATP-binding cassette subfamily F protein uup
MRVALDLDKTVAETISPGSDWVEVGGGKKHVMSYLGDFLFSPRRAASPVRQLSGGERNRLLLARLFAKPANVLVLDEPTNDLDIESLELLEAALQDYDGTLLLVSHDRTFLDNVVTQTLAAEGGGRWHEYPGGYSDWLIQRSEPPAASRQPSGEAAKEATKSSPPARGGVAQSAGVVGGGAGQTSDRPRVKLNNKEKRELDSLPREISTLESEQQALATKATSPDYYRQSPEILRADQARNAEIEKLLLEKLERWEALDAKAKAAAS